MMDYDLIIVGGGPAGVAAGVYAARKKIKTILLTDSFGGQSLVSEEIRNWIGDLKVSGLELADRFKEHLKSYGEGIEILEGEKAARVYEAKGGWTVQTESGRKIETRTLLVATGSRHKKLGIPGEAKFEGRGVFYCATCDAPLMHGKRAAVVGGGNAGLEAARDLLSYADRVYLLHRRDTLKGDQITADKVRQSDKVEFLLNVAIQEIQGENFVNGIVYKDNASGATRELLVDGVFVEIGAAPNSDFLSGLVRLDERGQIIIECKTQRTSRPGIWAAGDVTDVLYKQNNVSAGDGVKAALNIYEYLHSN